MAEHGAVKLIPPAKVMAAELERQLAAAVRSSVIDRILREAKAEQQISNARSSGLVGLRSSKASRPCLPPMTSSRGAISFETPCGGWHRGFEPDAPAQLPGHQASTTML